jgi:hypothetical protein
MMLLLVQCMTSSIRLIVPYPAAPICADLIDSKQDGNVSGANQPLRTTVQTSNLGHMTLIQGGVGESGRGDLQKCD